MTATRFFVYGSMCEGMVHFSHIKDFVLGIVPASIQATAFRLGVGFPVITKQQRNWVSGHLVQLKMSDLLLGLLDEFYGFHSLQPDKSICSRELTSVRLAGDEIVNGVYAYFFNPLRLPKDAQLIDDGDWSSSLQIQPALTTKLSEKQSIYVRRLGQSSGREIIPIDLPLYRELMKLGLIVDKGRRLALSQLGREVYKYLD